MPLFPDPAKGDDFLNDDLSFSEVSVIDPMELPLDRDLLIAASERKLELLRGFSGLDRNNEGHQTLVRHRIQQLVDWLAWLRKEPEREIEVSLYPTKGVSELLPDIPLLSEEDEQRLLDEYDAEKGEDDPF